MNIKSIMELEWGISTRKRKHARNDSYDNDEYNWGNAAPKKRIAHNMESTHPLIYSVNNEIHFSTDINTQTIETLIKEISMIISCHKKKHNVSEKLEITLVVDSPGGSVLGILKFCDFIRHAKKNHPYVTFRSIITGLVASAGTIMCVICDKRCMMKNAYSMIHELSTGNQGKYTHIMSHNDFIKQLHDNLVQIYLDNGCAKSREELEVLLKNETWYNAEDYKRLGLIDEIL